MPKLLEVHGCSEEQSVFLSPWGALLAERGKHLSVVVSFTLRMWPVPSPERGAGWHSPAAPVGNRRPGACGNAFGRRGCPRRGWCTCPGLTPLLRVWPGGRPAPLCTRDAEPSGTTGGSTAVAYEGQNEGLGPCSRCASHGETNFDIKLNGNKHFLTLLYSHPWLFGKLYSAALLNI